LYGGKPVMSDIVIIGIDDASLQAIGRWPWGRGNFTELAERLDGAQVIAFDIAFFEPSEKDDDASFAAAIAGRPVVLVSEYSSFKEVGNSVRGDILMLPVSPMTAKTGYSNIVTDSDGIVRSINLDVGDEPAFSAAVYERVTGAPYPRADRFLVSFPGPPGSFKRYSAADVLSGKIPSSEFAGKIVLIGATARDFHDDGIIPTSDGVPMPGVEIHASALQTMLLDNPLHEAPGWLTLLSIIAAVIIIFVLTWRFPPAVAGALSLGFIILYVLACLFIYEQDMLLNAVYPPLAIIITYLAMLSFDLVQERLAKKKVSDAFGKYVGPALLDEILKKGEVPLGGERKELTILFSDIRGFTSISEALTPEELVEFLNRYLDRATSVIMEERGLVDKFIGDAVMAFWNAPVPDKRHAERAVRSAIRMRSALDDISVTRGTKHPSLDVGIGINTGEAIVGNVGSQQRLSYTAIGDSVNLASRLESLTKEYGVRIIISENTLAALRKEKADGMFILRELDRVKVKGKKEPVRIYEVVCSVGEGHSVDLASYAKALALYYAGDWSAALSAFSAMSDKTSMLMAERCAVFIENPPEKWDGSYTMEHK